MDYKALNISKEMVEELSKTYNIEAELKGTVWKLVSISPKTVGTPNVRMPEKRTVNNHKENKSLKAMGWNECIDVINELNKCK